MIPCTGDCVYQKDGQCELSHAATGSAGEAGDCRYRVAKRQSTAHSAYTYEWYNGL